MSPDKRLPAISVRTIEAVEALDGILWVTLSASAHDRDEPARMLLLTFDIEVAQNLQSRFQATVPHARRQIGA